MDNASKRIMRSFVEEYLPDKELVIVDVGSLNVNGTYHGSLQNPKWKYIGLDIVPGKNVDLVVKDPYIWAELPENYADFVISGQTLEHVEFPWLTIKEIQRVLKPGGMACIIAPSAGYEHRYPVDCWRILPDGFRALAKWAGLKVITINKEEKSLWNLVSIICQK